MKILCVIDDLNAGGAQRQLVAISLYMVKKGYQVEFVTYYNNDDFYHETLKEYGIPHTIIPPCNYISRIIEIRKVIRKGKFQIVLSFLETPSFICEIIDYPFRKWKVIVGERSSNPKILTSIKLRFYRWVHILADAVVFNSYSNLDMVRRINPLLPTQKLHVIYNWIDLEKFNPPADYTPRADGKTKIVVVASHQQLKNLDLLVEAVSLLSPNLRNKLSIEWYGDRINGNYYDSSFPQAIKKIDQLGLQSVFSFFPAQKGIEEKMKMADFIGLFSQYEGLSNVICEGMALGKPILATRVSDNSRLIKDGKNGYLCLASAQGIEQLLNRSIEIPDKLLISMGIQSKQMAEEFFIQKNTLGKYNCLFNELLK